MKQLFCMALLAVSCKLSAQNITIPFTQSPPVIDGTMAPGEWSGAASVSIPVNVSDSVRVRCLYDDSAVYFLFTGKLESANIFFPEVLVDPKTKRGSSWTTEQWWFHVSATDCEHEGAYGVYNSCAAIQPGWQGAPNFTPGLPYTDMVEMKLPFSKLGLSAAPDSMGLAFVVTNTATIWKLWPAAADRNVPSTWAMARFGGAASIEANPAGVNGVRVYPSPVRETLHIDGCTNCWLNLTDVSGRMVLRKKIEGLNERVPIAHLPHGTYSVGLRSSSTNQSYRQVIIK